MSSPIYTPTEHDNGTGYVETERRCEVIPVEVEVSESKPLPPGIFDADYWAERYTLEKQLADVTELARRYAQPGVNVGAHALAVQVLHVLGVRESIDTSLLDGGDE